MIYIYIYINYQSSVCYIILSIVYSSMWIFNFEHIQFKKNIIIKSEIKIITILLFYLLWNVINN